ncbi:MAG TPA: MYG1 family protein [Mycobacterium sp.]|nr:MYG1 family protein [Mycobacterium sp.]
MVIATHDGSFHADEVFAVAALGLLGEPVEVIRTRDREALERADVRVDVGFRHDPSTGDFDHHQREFDLVRDNGVRYASFGLVWREFGARICDGDPEVADTVDAGLVQAVDANDTGQQLTRPLIDSVHPMTVSGIIGGFNARWDEELAAAEEGERFDAAVALARDILVRETASAASARRSTRLVREAIAAAADPRLVELPVNAPWKQVLVPEAPEALFVIYPKRQGFGLEAVPRELGSFENRRDLPASWGGLDGDDLVSVSGVPDALFCHAKRFLVVARSRNGIKQLAELALAGESGAGGEPA